MFRRSGGASQLIGAMAWVEAEIDFSDEGDVQEGLSERARVIAENIRSEIDQMLADRGSAERMRDGAVIVVAGPPNVGKSSFLNRVARREIAIVSPHAGTTRDLLEVQIDLGGYPATLIDTAGIREASDPVEIEALRRARTMADAADLVLWFEDATDAKRAPGPVRDGPVWTVVNKADLVEPAPAWKSQGRFVISAARGDGFDELLGALQAWLEHFFVPPESAPITRARHRQALEEARARLAGAVAANETELLAEELRLSARAARSYLRPRRRRGSPGRHLCRAVHRKVSVSRETKQL